jgi:hypothetical protein
VNELLYESIPLTPEQLRDIEFVRLNKNVHDGFLHWNNLSNLEECAKTKREFDELIERSSLSGHCKSCFVVIGIIFGIP